MNKDCFLVIITYLFNIFSILLCLCTSINLSMPTGVIIVVNNLNLFLNRITREVT